MKLIILEGPDGVGKSTQAARLCKALSAKLVVQPSGDNCLGFLRPIVKTEPNIEPFARQLLHTCSHIVDAYEDFGPHNKTIVMDRCYASALVYGKLTGLPEQQIEILRQIHQNVYTPLIEKHGYHVHYIQFTGAEPLRTAHSGDVYEKAAKWQKVNDLYLKLYGEIAQTPLFTTHEEHTLVAVDGQTEDQITQNILQTLL